MDKIRSHTVGAIEIIEEVIITADTVMSPLWALRMISNKSGVATKQPGIAKYGEMIRSVRF